MPAWSVFGGVVLLLTVGFVWLAHASARSVRGAIESDDFGDPATAATTDVLESDRLLLANVLASHGGLLVLLVVTIWLAAIPGGAVGVGAVTTGDIVAGIGIGLALSAGNEASARIADRVGIDYDERLRTMLAPDSTVGWITLLLVVLPLVAIAEELLFRGALVGGLAAGYGLPTWGLVVVSSVLFGFGHGLQGQAGVVVTAALGLGLAAAFVVTGSLTVVIIAHYLVNAIEFVVNEGHDDHGAPGG